MRIAGLKNWLRRRLRSTHGPGQGVTRVRDNRTHPDQPQAPPWYTAPTKQFPVYNRVTLGQSCLYDINRRPR